MPNNPKNPRVSFPNETQDAVLPPPVKIVAIGASAGGLEAVKELLSATPPDTGACFVYVQHLDPTHKSLLVDLLGRCTEMPVRQAEDGLEPVANTVVLIPPDSTLSLSGGVFRVEKPAPPRQHRTPIDTFFESVASELSEWSVCILLSGTGSDGTHGLSLVKEAGGLTIVQTSSSAKYAGMPQNALATGFVDHDLAPSEIPSIIIDHFARLNQIIADGGLPRLQERMSGTLTKICAVLRARTGHDFREYKEATMSRRINRRMQVLRIDDPSDYVTRLKEDTSEVGKLLRELLISVTGFFRDPHAFTELEQKVIADLVRKRSDTTLRVWVPGCATGEEAYSLAMSIRHYADLAESNTRIQLFATDIDERALETARKGTYSDTAISKVPEHYRDQYFVREGSNYRVADELRELCIFSTQNLIKDPPFSRIDLLVCRNVLIYLRPELQDRVLPTFHYSLRSGGYLFLGTAENVTRHGNLFEAVSPKWRIFRRKEVEGRPSFSSMGPRSTQRDAEDDQTNAAQGDKAKRAQSIVQQAERVLVDTVGPPFVIVSQDREVVYSGGDVSAYLVVPRGQATHDLVAMARADIRMDIRTVLHRTMSGNAEASADLVVNIGDVGRRLRLECRPLGEYNGKATFLLSFHDCGSVDGVAGVASGDAEGNYQALERELATTREHLQTTTEELESSNEELKSANEELMSMNEELQSSNEELETSKEELQSINEELETVNAELSAKVEELGQSNSDLKNLLESTGVATIFLDNNITIRRFTPKAKELFNLIEADVGRNINDITTQIIGDHPLTNIKAVMESLTTAREEIRIAGDDRRFLMRILPYRRQSGVVDGVVMTFVDITELSNAEAAARRRAEQQNYVASLTQKVLDGQDISQILHDVPQKAAELLAADYGKILRVQDHGESFELLSGYGFAEPPGTLVPGGMQSQAGFTFTSEEAVVVEDLKEERRFSGPAILTANHVRSGISTVIAGPEGKWGVLGIHSRDVRSFTHDDVGFIATVTRVISTALVREQTLRDLSESRERLAAALRAGRLGVHDFDPRTKQVKWDALVYALWGIPEGTDIDFDRFLEGILPGDRAAVLEELDRALDPERGGHFLSEYRVIDGGTGEIRWVRADGNVQFLNGQAVRLVGTATDVSEERRVAEQTRMLMREVNHRSKNLMAVVQAIARQTARDEGASTFVGDFTDRLAGLARAQDLIIEGSWSAVDIRSLVGSQTAHLGTSIADRIYSSGETLLVTPAAAQALALAFHELGTNALKYGSLSQQTGTVQISWLLKGDLLEINWVEAGGPPVIKPTKKGFGTTVIKRLAASALNAEVNVTFDPQGVRWKAVAPVATTIVREAPDGSSSLPDLPTNKRPLGT